MNCLNSDWGERLRNRAKHPAFRSARVALDRTVGKYRNRLPEIPDRQAGYYHDYFCTDHAVQLVFDVGSPHRHRCPVDDRVVSGEPYDSAWRWFVNDALSDAALRISLRAYLYSGSCARDRRQVMEILSGYAKRYTSLPPLPRPSPAHPGVVTWTGLDESVWILRLAWSYLFLSESLSDAFKFDLRENLFRPALAHLIKVRWPEIHNATNWNNAALVTLALLLGERELLHEFLYGALGLQDQLDRGVDADGLWWEGSLSYHYYALAAISWTLRVLQATGLAFDDGGTVRQMFLAPIEVSFPDLSLPSVNDCWHFIGLTGELGHGIPDAAGFYESALAWFAEPAFAWVLNENYQSRPRCSLEVLLDGVETIPSADRPVLVSRHLAESGLVVLRTRGGCSTLILKSGPSGGGHGHPDQLGLQLFVQGKLFTPDLGTPGYGIDLNASWYQQTGSHSTVLVDGQSQPPTTGRFNSVRCWEDAMLADAAVSWGGGGGGDGDGYGPYDGVEMRRVICWRDLYFVDVFLVSCPTVRQIDWVYHNRGVLLFNDTDGSRGPVGPTSSGGSAPRKDSGLGGECGFRHIRLTERIRVDGRKTNARLRWELDDVSLNGLMVLCGAEEMMFGTAPSNPASQQQSVTIRRQIGMRASFVTAFVPTTTGNSRVVESVSCTAGSGGAHLITVCASGHEDRWRISSDPVAAELLDASQED